MSTNRGFTPWIVREVGRRRAVIGWFFPDTGSGPFGCALNVSDGGTQVYSVMRPFRVAVPRANLLLSSGLANLSCESDEKLAQAVAEVDSRPEAIGDAPPVFVHELNNIRAEVLPTLIVNPPGFRVRIFVDQQHIVDVLKDANSVSNPDGSPKPTPPYDLETAIARAREMVADLQG